jgi:hypothetical protein
MKDIIVVTKEDGSSKYRKAITVANIQLQRGRAEEDREDPGQH